MSLTLLLVAAISCELASVRYRINLCLTDKGQAVVVRTATVGVWQGVQETSASELHHRAFKCDFDGTR